MKLLSAMRTRVGIAVTGAALLTVGGTAAAAVVVTSPGTSEVSEVSDVTGPAPTTAAAPTEEVPTATTDAPPAAPAAEVPAATVEPVTEPAPQTPDVDPADEGIGTTGEDGRYTPAPPIPRAGEPTVVPDSGGVPAEKLPGEPGYVPPTPQG